MEELKVGDRVQLLIPEWISKGRVLDKDYTGTLEEKTRTGWFIAWDDGYEDLLPDYQDDELRKVDG